MATRHAGATNAALAIGVYGEKGGGLGTLISIPYGETEETPLNASHRHLSSRDTLLKDSKRLLIPEPTVEWESALEKFSQANGVSVLSDAYDVWDCPEPMPSLPSGWSASEDPARALDQFCARYDYQWDASVPLMVFRRRTWSVLRSRQIPETAWRTWRLIAARSDRFALDDLAQMTGMNRNQQAKLPKYAGMAAAREVQRNEMMLSFYSLLLRKQRADALEGGLGVERLSLSQKRQLTEICAQRGTSVNKLSDGPTLISILDNPESDHTSIVITFRDKTHEVFRFNSRPRPLGDPWSHNRSAARS